MYDGREGSKKMRGKKQGVPVAELMRFMMEGLPVAAIAHSYHVDALVDPRVGSNPQFQEFSLIELNELHHQIAALGSLLRLEIGDPMAQESLGMNLAGFLENRQAALAVASRFPPLVTNNPAVKKMMDLTQVSNEQVEANWPLIQETLAATGAPSPGALLVSPGHH